MFYIQWSTFYTRITTSYTCQMQHKQIFNVNIFCAVRTLFLVTSYWFVLRRWCLCWCRWDTRLPRWRSTVCRDPASAGWRWSSSLRPASVHRKHVSGETQRHLSQLSDKWLTHEQDHQSQQSDLAWSSVLTCGVIQFDHQYWKRSY